MIPDSLAIAVRDLRTNFVTAIQTLENIDSFRSLLKGSEKVATQWKGIREALESPRLSREVRAQFTCAVVGSSSHGKTSILSEMFPNLTQRGWLVTDVSDTTSQALKIRPSVNPAGQAGVQDGGQVIVHSWNLGQIGRLVQAASAENARLGVDVSYRPQFIEINGEEANFPADEKRRFRFPLRQQLRPMSRSYTLNESELRDATLIRALTVKETSERVRSDPVLSVDGQPFHALQLRAAVKSVELADPYTEFLRWSGMAEADIGKLVFLDTPGLNVVGSVKDEVLRAVLGRKNQQIIVELLKDDDLDIIVHLVLAGQQSAFAQLWGPLRQECSAEDLVDLAERVVLVVNGANIYFTNDDLRRKWEPESAKREGDPFAVTLESNIIERMAESGRFLPARICFVDSKRIVEAAGRSYEETYAGYVPLLKKCLEVGAVGHDTLARLGILPHLAENITALADPADRGQGFLVRTVLDLLRTRGPSLFIRKHLVRSKMTQVLKSVRSLLARHYDDNGQMENSQALEQVLATFFPSVKPAELETLERYYETNLRGDIDAIVPEGTKGQPENQFVRYKIRRETLIALRDAGAPVRWLDGLKSKVGVEFESEDSLIGELKAVPGLERWERWRGLAVKECRICVWPSNAYVALCRLIFNTAVEGAARHQLDDKSLTAIGSAINTATGNAAAARKIASKLANLRGKKPMARAAFEMQIVGALSPEELKHSLTTILKMTKLPPSKDEDRLKTILQKYVTELINRWRVDWGYKSADLPTPSPQQGLSADLLRHALHLHAREILYQIINGASSAKAIVQDESDRQKVKAVLLSLDTVQRQSEDLVREHGGVR